MFLDFPQGRAAVATILKKRTLIEKEPVKIAIAGLARPSMQGSDYQSIEFVLPNTIRPDTAIFMDSIPLSPTKLKGMDLITNSAIESETLYEPNQLVILDRHSSALYIFDVPKDDPILKDGVVILTLVNRFDAIMEGSEVVFNFWSIEEVDAEVTKDLILKHTRVIETVTWYNMIDHLEVDNFITDDSQVFNLLLSCLTSEHDASWRKVKLDELSKLSKDAAEWAEKRWELPSSQRRWKIIELPVGYKIIKE